MGIIFSPDEIAWIENHIEIIESGNVRRVYELLVEGPDRNYNDLGLSVKLIFLIPYLNKWWEWFHFEGQMGKAGWFGIYCDTEPTHTYSHRIQIASTHSNMDISTKQGVIDILTEDIYSLNVHLKRTGPTFLKMVKEVLNHIL